MIPSAANLPPQAFYGNGAPFGTNTHTSVVGAENETPKPPKSSYYQKNKNAQGAINSSKDYGKGSSDRYRQNTYNAAENAYYLSNT